MENGKIVTIFAGVITLLSTFVLNWYTLTLDYAVYYTNGLGYLQNFPDVILHGRKYADYLNLPLWIVYVMSIFMFFILIAGVLQILIVKKPILGIIGSLIPLALGIVILVGFTMMPDWLKYLEIFGDRSPIILGGLPLVLEIPGRPESLGTYGLIVGGIMGIIGIIMAKEDLY